MDISHSSKYDYRSGQANRDKLQAELRSVPPQAASSDPEPKSADGKEIRIIPAEIPETVQPSAEQTIAKALSASGLPATERTRTLVRELLNHKLPIDKQTLQMFAKLLAANREAFPLTLVIMYKHHIPLTASNIRQFEAYQKESGQLLTDIRSLAKNITDLLKTMSLPENPAVSAAKSSERSDNPHGDAGLNPMTPSGTKIVPEDLTASGDLSRSMSGNAAISADGRSPLASYDNSSVDFSQQAAKAEDGVYPDAVVASNYLNSDLPASDKSLTSAPLIQENTAGTLMPTAPAVSSAAAPPDGPGTGHSPGNSPDNSPEADASGDILRWLSEALADSGQDNQHPKLYSDGLIHTLTKGTLYTEDKNIQLTDIPLKTGLWNEGLTPSVGEGLPDAPDRAEELTAYIEALLHQKWTLTPEQLSKKTPLIKLYQKLEEDVKKLERLLSFHRESVELSQAEKPVKSIQDNLRFMKDLNQLFSYVQLPIQLKGRDIHGELYVFNKKNALRNKKDILSVILHLDMAELGPLNIHLKIESERIQATFSVEDSEAGSIIRNHLAELTNALAKKGYQLQARVEKPEQKRDFIKDILEQDASDHSAVTYSFDIKA